MSAVQMTEGQFVDELTYRNYAENRRLSPEISPERWAAIYPNVPAMEQRYQCEHNPGPLVVELDEARLDQVVGGAVVPDDCRERIDMVCSICGVKHCHGHPDERGAGR